MSIYLDVCCLFRPFDNEAQDRVRLEAEAVLAIISLATERGWTLVGSDVVDHEIDGHPDEEKRVRARGLAAALQVRVPLSNIIVERGVELEEFGFRTFDALHVASAEAGEVDVLLTTDDQFLRKGIEYSKKLSVKIENPVAWLIKEITL